MNDEWIIYGEMYGHYDHDVDITGMTIPVQCLRCHHGIYDLAAVTVTARYADCSVWRTPCCDVVVDDRGETGWTSRADYARLKKNI